jgi:hypothetical protein
VRGGVRGMTAEPQPARCINGDGRPEWCLCRLCEECCTRECRKCEECR